MVGHGISGMEVGESTDLVEQVQWPGTTVRPARTIAMIEMLLGGKSNSNSSGMATARRAAARRAIARAEASHGMANPTAAAAVVLPVV